MAWIVTQLVQNALRMLAVVAGIFFLGGWAWFAYFAGRDVEARSLSMTKPGVISHASASPRDPADSTAATATAEADVDAEAYARKVFGGLLPIEQVLASKVRGATGAGPDCSYAIIRTGGGIARTPPTSAVGTAWWERFGGDWRQTPRTADTVVDALATCSDDWDAELRAELRQALDAPGNWYMRDEVGSDLHIYSASDRIAARIRYGD